MKKWIKRNIKRICAIVMVSIMALSMCIAISADDSILDTYPTDIDDGSLIVTYSNNDVFSIGSEPFTYNYQVIPSNAFGFYDATNYAFPKGEIRYTVDNSIYQTYFVDGAYASNAYLEVFNRKFTMHNFSLSSDNYVKFDFNYFVPYYAINPTLAISITYRLNGTSTVFNKSFTYDDFDFDTSFDNSSFYSLLGVDNSLTINIDTLEFQLFHAFTQNTVESIGFSLNISYYDDTIFVDTPIDNPSDGESEIPSAVFRDYVSWIAVAVGGFFAFELFPNFYLGGILVIMIAFTLVMWWLKMFGGG